MSQVPAAEAQFSATKMTRRMGRRETHSGRAAPSIVTAAVLLAATVWLALELVLSATGNRALLIQPSELLRRAVSLPADTPPAAMLAAGVVLGLLGLACLAAAVLPGTRARHVLADPRSAVVVDSEVLAAAVARAARRAARLAPGRVSARVGRGRVEVMVRPESGHEADSAAIREAVEREVSGYGLQRPLAVSVSVGPHGAVGA